MASWSSTYNKMKNNTTDGSEFNNGQKVDGNPKIGHTTCEYCGREVLCIWDDYNRSNWFPYLGNQSRKPNVYKYSPIIQIMRKFYHAENKAWTNNPLMNLHARCHCEPEDWSKRAHPNGIKVLCCDCFQKTYNRIKVLGDNGITYSLSVVPERGETIESVMSDLDIKGKIIGKGAIKNY